MSSKRLDIDTDIDNDESKYVVLKVMKLKIVKASNDLTTEYETSVARNEGIIMWEINTDGYKYVVLSALKLEITKARID